MALTVADVLELDVMRSADAVVLAGEDSLDRPVRWVHVTELPDIAYLLNGGELVLTTGVGVGRDGTVQCRFVRELEATGCAGLVIELLRLFTAPPPAMVAEANRCGLPLIGLQREARFVEITERVHVAIINEQYALLLKADAIAREFTGLALRGGGLGPVLERLSRVVGNPIVLEDAAHQVVEYAAHDFEVEELLAAWERHSRSGHGQRDAGVHTVAGNPSCAWTAISLREELWGRLHAIELARRLDEIDRLALDRAAAAVGMALLSERDATHAADQACRSLIADVVGGRTARRAELNHRARALGTEISDKQLGVLVVGFSPDRQGSATDGHDETRPGRSILREVRAAIRRRGATVIAALENHEVLAIVGLTRDDSADDLLLTIARDVRDACEAGESGLGAVVGVSLEREPDCLRRVFEEACEALRYGLRIDAGGVYRYGDLGIHHLLVRLGEGPELAAFVESELQPLLEHDARASVPLLPTLRTYLATGGNKAEAARRLFVERRTLYRRLERIGELLGAEQGDHQRWLRLTIAIQGLDVLRERTPVRGRERTPTRGR